MTAPRGVLAIVGATATGKSALAVETALRLGGEVISADAFTAYRGIDAGTAKPTLEERRGVPHHLIDLKEPTDPFSAGEFARLARASAREILSRGKLPILCGGTGFYVRAFFEGLFVGPPRDERLREALRRVEARRGAAWLVRALSLLDPQSGARISLKDGARAIRYLEIAVSTGRRPSDLFRERPGERWDGPSV
ncbi:partial tRNA dimethylallyltransferase, partial [Gammaproteobacteria bacterium]